MTRNLLNASVLRWVFIALMILVGFGVVLQFFPIGTDYYYYYRPIADQWINGDRTMYDGPNHRLFYPPWNLFIILPLGFLSIKGGSALLNYTSLLLLLLSIRLIQRIKPAPLLAVLLSILNLHTINLLLLGQLDLFALAGVIVGWWAILKNKPLLLGVAFCLMAMKPVNLVFVLILFLVAIRGWPLRSIAQAFLLPIVMILISSALVGFDWPLKYIANFEEPATLLAISLWRGLEYVGLPAWPFMILSVIAVLAFLRLAWREGLSERTISIAIATSLVFTVYGHSDYYVLLIPAFIYVARRDWRVAALAYLTTWALLLRLPYGGSASWVCIFYPIVLLLGAWFLPTTSLRRSASLSQQPISSSQRPAQ